MHPITHTIVTLRGREGEGVRWEGVKGEGEGGSSHLHQMWGDGEEEYVTHCYHSQQVEHLPGEGGDQ